MASQEAAAARALYARPSESKAAAEAAAEAEAEAEAKVAEGKSEAGAESDDGIDSLHDTMDSMCSENQNVLLSSLGSIVKADLKQRSRPPTPDQVGIGEGAT